MKFFNSVNCKVTNRQCGGEVSTAPVTVKMGEKGGYINSGRDATIFDNFTRQTPKIFVNIKLDRSPHLYHLLLLSNFFVAC